MKSLRKIALVMAAFALISCLPFRASAASFSFEAQDKSENCISTESGFPLLMEEDAYDDGDAYFCYYMYSGINSPNDPGSIDVHYISKTPVQLGKDVEYTFSFQVYTNWTVESVENEAVTISMRSEPSADSEALIVLGSADVSENQENTRRTVAFTFTADQAGNYYPDLNLTGILTETIFEIRFSNVSITTEHVCSYDNGCDPECNQCALTRDNLIHEYPQEWTVAEEATTQKEGLRQKICANCGNELTEAIAVVAAPATQPTTPVPSGEPDPAPAGDNILITVLIIAAVVIAGGAAFLVIKKRK